MRFNVALPIIVFAGAALITILGTVGLLPALPRNNFWVIFSTLFLAGSVVGAAQVFAGLPVAIGFLAAIALAFAGIGERLLAWQLLLTAVVIAVGCIALPKRVRLPLDLSYGIYLYAFPIQQLSATLFADFWPALAFSTVITFALALMSALFIERYALRLKNRSVLLRFAAKPAHQVAALPGAAPAKISYDAASPGDSAPMLPALNNPHGRDVQ
jgi:peptidoglycan/LPS O-acetylase OafA/YrhL